MCENLPIYPAVGEIFELTLDGDMPENQPLEMVRHDGFDPNDWQHNGPVIKGQHAKHFKLVKVGYCRDLIELRRKLLAHGEIPEGQWREALNATYRSDGRGPVGIADPSWFDPYGFVSFPCIHTVSVSDFDRAHYGFGDDWRWLVLASK